MASHSGGLYRREGSTCVKCCNIMYNWTGENEVRKGKSGTVNIREDEKTTLGNGH